MEAKTFFVMSSSEYDELVKENLGIDVEFVADEEANNGCSYIYEIEEKDVKKFIERMIGDLYWPRNALMWMAINGQIPFGSYLIKVSW